MTIHELIERSDGRPWNSVRVERLLAEFWQSGQAGDKLAQYLKELQYPEPSVTRTAELHSWKLYRTPEWDLALNQFVPFLEERQASENIHNHTRPLVSLTIQGGYSQSYYTPRRHLCEYRDGDCWLGDLEENPGPSTAPGMVYTIGTSVFHALTCFEPGTMSLVVYGPLESDCIVCFNQISGRVERRRTATHAKQRLIDNLRGRAHQEQP